MSKRIHTLVLGLLLSLMLIGTARSAINGGGEPAPEPTTCARCTDNSACGGGYASGGTDCISQCRWNTKLRKWDNCSCYTVGDCPGKGGGGGGIVMQ